MENKEKTFALILLFIISFILWYIFGVCIFSLLIYLLNIGGMDITFNAWIGGLILLILYYFFNIQINCLDIGE